MVDLPLTNTSIASQETNSIPQFSKIKIQALVSEPTSASGATPDKFIATQNGFMVTLIRPRNHVINPKHPTSPIEVTEWARIIELPKRPASSNLLV
jgi:hypothetical protein